MTGKVQGKRLEFNDIQASYDTELIDVIIIMDCGSETLESKYISTQNRVRPILA